MTRAGATVKALMRRRCARSGLDLGTLTSREMQSPAFPRTMRSLDPLRHSGCGREDLRRRAWMLSWGHGEEDDL